MTRKSAYSLLLSLAIVVASGIFTTSCKNDDDKTVWDQYASWRNDNNAWLAAQQTLTDAAGKPYFTSYVPNWNQSSFVLLHFYNDTELTKDNLSPISTSTVDVRYRLFLYDGTPVDSSTNITANGPGIFRTRLDRVIPGWTAALSQMHVGDTARVVIPYGMAYGNSISAAIPPFSNLTFEIRLVGIPYYVTSPY